MGPKGALGSSMVSPQKKQMAPIRVPQGEHGKGLSQSIDRAKGKQQRRADPSLGPEKKTGSRTWRELAFVR